MATKSETNLPRAKRANLSPGFERNLRPNTARSSSPTATNNNNNGNNSNNHNSHVRLAPQPLSKVPGPYTSASPPNTRHYSASSVTGTTPHSSTLSTLFPLNLIDNAQFSTLANNYRSRPLPECDELFPWLHGHTTPAIPPARALVPVRSASIRPSAGECSSHQASGILKGSVEPTEVLHRLNVSAERLEEILATVLKDCHLHKLAPDQFQSVFETLKEDCLKCSLVPIFKNELPRALSLRNFHIQVAKTTQIADFIVYCFNEDHQSKLERTGGEDQEFSSIKSCCCDSVARLLYVAQLKHAIDHPELVDALYQTMIIRDSNLEFYQKKQNRNLLALDKLDIDDILRDDDKLCSKFDIECFKNWDSNYLLREKFEIAKMSSATRVEGNVWFGNSTDYEILRVKGFQPNISTKIERSQTPLYIDPSNSTVILKDDFTEESLINLPKANWELFVSCSDGSTFPELITLQKLLEDTEELADLKFPPSGSVGVGDCSVADSLSILNTCKYIYTRSTRSISTFIYCSDGYTESSLLGVCYLIYVTGKSLKEITLDLHKKYGRPFFLFPTDVHLISRIEGILTSFSPAVLKEEFNPGCFDLLDNETIYQKFFTPNEKDWCTKLNGSLPSRILPHLYLGSLNHANSLELLQNLEIENIVAVGETLGWLGNEKGLTFTPINPNISVISGFKNSPLKKIMCVSNVQDDGIDMLTHNLEDILSFIQDIYALGEKVLVHCRVGVSRSATVCIAEVMKRLKINLVKAYIYVRVRRLNIIIQPNLRFMYELVKWEESQRMKRKNKKALELSPNASQLIASVELSKALSASISSISSSITQMSTTNLLLDGAPESPIKMHSLEHAIEDDSDGEEYDEFVPLQEEFDDDTLTEEIWLRDVDWHVLCREIDILNKAYIREP